MPILSTPITDDIAFLETTLASRCMSREERFEALLAVVADPQNKLEALRTRAAQLLGGLEMPSSTMDLTGPTVDLTRGRVVDEIAYDLFDIWRRTRRRGVCARGVMTIETELADGAFHMQLRARARFDDVIWECSSGFRGAPNIHRTTRKEREQLVALGFSDRVRGNHKKVITLDNRASAQRVAEEAMRILEETMGWTPRSRTTLRTNHQ